MEIFRKNLSSRFPTKAVAWLAPIDVGLTEGWILQIEIARIDKLLFVVQWSPMNYTAPFKLHLELLEQIGILGFPPS